MKCELCEKEKHCVALDLEWTLLEYVCEDCMDKYMSKGFVDYDKLEEDQKKGGGNN